MRNIILPKRLATTMGYELTYMPMMLDDIYIASQGRIKGWNSHVSNVNEFLKFAMRDFMQSERRKDLPLFRDFKLDPSVVEVTTQPLQSSRKLMRAVKSCNEVAEIVGLVPRALWTRGGGAHLHVGIPYNARREEAKHERFNGVMQYMAQHNPWIAWAFANPLDDGNASQYTGECVDTSLNNQRAPRHRNSHVVNEYLSHRSEMESYRKLVIDMTNNLHTKDTWGSDDCSYDTRRRVRRMDDVNCYARNMMMYRKFAAQAEKKMLAEMESDWNAAHAPAPEESVVTLHNTRTIRINETKSKFLTQRSHGMNGTWEFRCFMMYGHHSEHKKQVALANEFVRIAKDAVEWDKDVLVVRGTAPLLKDMKYSAAKAAFCSMLRELDFDPADFREECVNIALRKRAIRNRKINL